jgi:hypothetical protein
MARPLRIEYDGALYHVTSRGNERKRIFQDDTDRELFLNTLSQVNERFNWICHAYCLTQRPTWVRSLLLTSVVPLVYADRHVNEEQR